MTDQDKANIAANKRSWNETAEVHATTYVENLKSRIAAPDFTTFDDVEKKIFAELGLQGKDVAQLSCNNARELIAVKKAGAGRCVGFDISDKFIAQGRELVRAAGVSVELECTNLYDISHDYDASFDVIYVTVGAVGWLPDLSAYFEIIARLLKPGGRLFMYEMHPILNMFDSKKGLSADASYFRTEPFVNEGETDYLNPEAVIEEKSYWYPHRLDEIIGGCLQVGLKLTHFEEYAHDISSSYKAFAELKTPPPMCFSLLAQKSA